MDFNITPYVGAGPLKLGMTEDEVIATIHPPTRRVTNWQKHVQYRYDAYDLTVGFDARGRVDHLGFGPFGPESTVTFQGINLFSDKTAFHRLIQLDGHPYEHVGFINLLSLGLMLNGFHDRNEDDDQDDRAVCVIAQESLDEFQPEFKDFAIDGV